MNTRQAVLEYAGNTAVFTDSRTCARYRGRILDARISFGTLQWKLAEHGRWFEPSATEIESVRKAETPF